MVVARDRISVSMLAWVGARCWITTNAIPVSGCSARSIPVKASSPPAEAPMPTMGNGATVGRGFGSFTEIPGGGPPGARRGPELQGHLGDFGDIGSLSSGGCGRSIRVSPPARRGQAARTIAAARAARYASSGWLHGQDDGGVGA